MVTNKVPLVSIGLPVYNGEKYISKAIDSLLAQSFTDFELIISDNCSTDTTYAICQSYTLKDQRVKVFRQEKNVGAILNFRYVFVKAYGKYFMWASDHDRWHPDWLRLHVNVLEKNTEVILAYPLMQAIGVDDEEFTHPTFRFETFGMNKFDRIRTVVTRMTGAGSLVYGLFRRTELRESGILPYCNRPDRLLLMVLAVYGTFKQIPQVLWYRRYFGPNMGYNREMRRQQRILYSPGKVPWYSFLPTLTLGVGLIYYLSLFPPNRSYVNVWFGFYMAYLYLRRKRRVLIQEFVRLFLNIFR